MKMSTNQWFNQQQEVAKLFHNSTKVPKCFLTYLLSDFSHQIIIKYIFFNSCNVIKECDSLQIIFVRHANVRIRIHNAFKENFGIPQHLQIIAKFFFSFKLNSWSRKSSEKILSLKILFIILCFFDGFFFSCFQFVFCFCFWILFLFFIFLFLIYLLYFSKIF